MKFRHRSMAEMFATFLHAIDSVKVHGVTALVVGGGPIGLAFVKLLKIREFETVVLSEPMEEKRTIGKALGAYTVLNPLSEDLQEIGKEVTRCIGFDVTFECSGGGNNI